MMDLGRSLGLALLLLAPAAGAAGAGLSVLCRGTEVTADDPWPLGTQKEGLRRTYTFTAVNTSTTKRLLFTGAPEHVSPSEPAGRLSLNQDLPSSLGSGDSAVFRIAVDSSGATPGVDIEGTVRIPWKLEGETESSTCEFTVAVAIATAESADINIRRQAGASIPRSPAVGVNFGSVAVGAQSARLTLLIENTGWMPLEVTGASIGNTTDFSLTPPALPLTLAAQETASFSIGFQPMSAATHEGVQVVIESSDPDVPESPFVILVRGSGTASPPGRPSGLRIKP